MKVGKISSISATGRGPLVPMCFSRAPTEFHARVACDSSGGNIEVHLDSLTGPLVATLRVSNTGGGQTWDNVSAALTPASGEHTVFLRFAGGTGDLFKITSFSLTPAAPVGLELQGQEKSCTRWAVAWWVTKIRLSSKRPSKLPGNRMLPWYLLELMNRWIRKATTAAIFTCPALNMSWCSRLRGQSPHDPGGFIQCPGGDQLGTRQPAGDCGRVIPWRAAG